MVIAFLVVSSSDVSYATSSIRRRGSLTWAAFRAATVCKPTVALMVASQSLQKLQRLLVKVTKSHQRFSSSFVRLLPPPRSSRKRQALSARRVSRGLRQEGESHPIAGLNLKHIFCTIKCPLNGLVEEEAVQGSSMSVIDVNSDSSFCHLC